MSAWYEPYTKGVRVSIKLTPGAAQSAVLGVVTLANQNRVLAVKVPAPAVQNKANLALVALLAKTWKLPKSTIEITHGEHDRVKQLEITGDPTELMAKLEGWEQSQNAVYKTKPF